MKRRRIDVHQHLVPPRWAAWLRAQGAADAGGFRRVRCRSRRLAFAKPGHVLFGSDWPYAPAPAVAYFTGQLDAHPGLDEPGRRAIDRESAAALFAKET